MSWLFAILGAAVLIALIAAIAARRRTPRDLILLPEHGPRIVVATRALATAPPWIPAQTNAPDGAAAIEAALIAGDPAKALAAAEAAVAATADAPGPRVWLAWALTASGEPTAALIQLDKARGLSPGAASPGPLATYIEARALHLAFELDTGATGAVPPLVTSGDVAIVTLAGARGGSAWMTGAEDVQISKEQLTSAIEAHRTATSRSLALALDALDAAPGFADAAYLVARLAVKSGAVTTGRALFDVLATRMAGRPDAEAFARDLRDLADPSGAVSAAMQPAPPATPPSAKRSRSLKVLR